MREITGTVKRCDIARFVKHAAESLNTFNSRKLGKIRRGLLKCNNISTRQMDDGDYWVTISLESGRPRYLKMMGRKFAVYNCTDFRPMLRLVKK